jgi:5-methyltetrahydrofolate--homocysteine methyltransferase
VHTAVKIAPHYEGPVVYVPDASRSVGVCSELLSDERAAKYIAELEADYERVRELHANKKVTPLVTLAQARANKTPIDWSAYVPPAPKFIGRRVFRNQDLAELAACIDWGPFFQTWDLAGRFPDILRDEVVGHEAQRVFSDGKRLLQRPSKAAGCRRAAWSRCCRPTRWTTTPSRSTPTRRRSEVALRWNPLRLQTERPVVDGVRGPTAAWPTSSRPRAWPPTTSACSR